GSKCVFSAARQMKRINPELVILAVDGPIIWGPNPGTIYKEIGAHIIPNNQLKNEIAFLKNNYKINGAGPSIPQNLLDKPGLVNRAIKVQQIEQGIMPANTNQAEIIC
ncbi:MAG: hypothetical protein KAT91_04295, partial [Candidatus Aenigmarchaeota archaeon]|nr:hypothetical protein [Candidatus Aenigmarchaeota archaeon]